MPREAFAENKALQFYLKPSSMKPTTAVPPFLMGVRSKSQEHLPQITPIHADSFFFRFAKIRG